MKYLARELALLDMHFGHILVVVLFDVYSILCKKMKTREMDRRR